MELIIISKFRNSIDQSFLQYFDRKLKQVFVYITDRCQLRCKQCLYKPNVTFGMQDKKIDPEILISLLNDFNLMGATKLSILGGEPSLYDRQNHHRDLIAVIKAAREIGYEYIRIDTNGQFDEKFLSKEGLQEIDEISFSLDGYNPATHDILRGDGTFVKCIQNIKKSIELGYRTHITTCVHRKLTEKHNGEYNLEKMIKFSETLNVRTINFHVLFKHGFPMDTWTDQTDIQVQEWVEIYQKLQTQIENQKYGIDVRIPTHFVSKKEFEKNPEYYGYCAAKLGERIMVHPNGILRICSGLISSPYGVGRFSDAKITWDHSKTNELLDHNYSEHTACTNQMKGMNTGGLMPLCFSFKPKQKEFVWNTKLVWDGRRID